MDDYAELVERLNEVSSYRNELAYQYTEKAARAIEALVRERDRANQMLDGAILAAKAMQERGREAGMREAADKADEIGKAWGVAMRSPAIVIRDAILALITPST